MNRKVPDQIVQLLAAINSLSLSDVYHFGDQLCTAVNNRQNSWWGSSEHKAELLARTVRNMAAASRAEQLAEIRRTNASKVLAPGMIVKMSGTRDGHGLRYVVSVTPHQVLCQQLKPAPSYSTDPAVLTVQIAATGGKVYSWHVTNHGTDHSLDKVMGIYVDADTPGIYHYKAFK